MAMTKNFIPGAAMLGICLCLSACSGPESLTVPMNLTASRAKVMPFSAALPASAKVVIGPVIDKRSEGNLLGAQNDEKKKTPIYAATPPADFFKRAVATDSSAMGLNVVNDAAAATHHLSFDLVRFTADESPSYRAEIVARAKLTDANGNVRWENSVSGFSTLFGKSLAAENYQQVLSDSMNMLVEGMLSNSSFQAGLK